MEETHCVSAVVSCRRLALAILLLTPALLSGCAVVSWVAPVYGEIENLSDPECSSSLSSQLASALEEQGETPDDAARAAARTVRLLPYRNVPLFEAASASGVTYGWNLAPRNSGECVLRIYERRKDGAVVDNTVNFFATRRLKGCTCSWVYYSEQTTYH